MSVHFLSRATVSPDGHQLQVGHVVFVVGKDMLLPEGDDKGSLDPPVLFIPSAKQLVLGLNQFNVEFLSLIEIGILKYRILFSLRSVIIIRVGLKLLSIYFF